MLTDVQICQCRNDDWPAACRLLTQVYVGDGYVVSERAEQFYRREVLEPAGTLLTATAGGELLGAVILLHKGSSLTQVALEREAEFRLLAVHTRGRGRGIGEALVSECVRCAAQPPLSACAMVLWTRPEMTAAQRLYTRTGFSREPDRDALLPPLPAGSTLERWVYRRAWA